MVSYRCYRCWDSVFGVESEVAGLKGLRFDRHGLYGQHVIVPSDEQRVVVLEVVKALKELAVIPFFSIADGRVLERVPELPLEPPNVLDL